MATYTVGVDFETLSCRAVLADTATGRELAVAEAAYAHTVIDCVLAVRGGAVSCEAMFPKRSTDPLPRRTRYTIDCTENIGLCTTISAGERIKL